MKADTTPPGGENRLSQQVIQIYEYGSQPNFMRFPYTGLNGISSASHKVTDSAAGATAFSCGVKTYNGAISVDTSHTASSTMLGRLPGKA